MEEFLKKRAKEDDELREEIENILRSLKRLKFYSNKHLHIQVLIT